MSIIKCPECGHDVSTKAPVCPNCGVEISGNLKRCPSCNTIMLQDTTECPKCHTPFAVNNANDETPLSTTQAEQPTEKEETKTPPKKSRAGKILWGGVAVLVVIIGLIVWQMIASREADAERAYSLLIHCNDPLDFEDFINRYPRSSHIEEVEMRLAELKEEEAAWHVAALTQNVDIVMEFVKNHPGSAYIVVAQHRIDTLDWRKADSEGKASSYATYIADHPAGDFITEAYAARDVAFKREERARIDSIRAAKMADSLTNSAPGIDNVFQY